jgi:hypothetical protein
MSQIIHLAIDLERDSFAAYMSDGAWVVYWFDEVLGCPVRQRRRMVGKDPVFDIKEPLANTWEELIGKADAHPANRLNKATPRIMQCYAEKKASDHLKRLKTEAVHA